MRIRCWSPGIGWELETNAVTNWHQARENISIHWTSAGVDGNTLRGIVDQLLPHPPQGERVLFCFGLFVSLLVLFVSLFVC